MPLFERDPELLLRFVRGERKALEAVYRFYVNDVWRMLRSGFSIGSAGAHVPGIMDRGALHDATQEVFAKAFALAGRQGYDGVRPYRPYLLRIGRNARIDQLRRNGREVLLADPGTESLHPEKACDSVHDPAEQLHWEEQQVATRAYIAGLDPERQRFVDLRFAQELSQLQAAERMGITRRRARTLEQNVLLDLRKTLARRGLR